MCVLAWVKLPTFRDGTTGCTAKWRLRNEHRNSILMTRHYPDSGSVSDWLNQISHAAWPIKGNSLSKQPTFRVATTGFPSKWRVSRTSVETPYCWRVTTQIQAVLLIGWSKFLTRHDQSEAIVTRHQYSMELLRSFLGRHFAGKANGGIAKWRLFSQATSVRI